MVSVPVAPRNSARVEQISSGRLRYQGARNMVGPAIEQAGAELRQTADDWDRIEATYDQADVLNLDNTFAAEVSAVKSEFSQLRGDSPGRELQPRLEALQKRADELATGARSERAANMLRRTVSVRLENARELLTTHADREMFAFRDSALVAGREQAALDAMDAAGTPQFGVAIGTGLTRIGERARLNGAPPEVLELEQQKFLDTVHGGVVDRMFAAPDPDVDAIGNYLAEFSDQMTPVLKNQTLTRLQGPLQGRVARSDADLVMGFAAPAEGGEVAGPPALALPQGPPGEVGAVLQKAGFSSAVVAGFLGNFDVEGGYGGAQGDGGSASGIAQFRGERRDNFRRRFGKEPHEASFAEQAQFVAWEMQNPQAAGMTVAQRDAILAAKTPADAAALIDQYYERSSGQHHTQRQAAAEKYGGAYSSTPREWDRAQVYANLESVAEREGWNPERTERVRAELDRRVERDEGLLREQQQDAGDRATEVVQSLGDNFKSVNQIPREVWNSLAPSDKMAWERVAEANSRPVEPPANGADVMTLNLMRYYEPERFKSLNLAQYAGKMTRAELDTMLTTQAQMRTREGQWSPRSGITTAMTFGKRINQMDLDKTDEAAILQIMEAEAWRMHEANGGKPLTEADYESLFRNATRSVDMQTRVLGFRTGTNERPRYELTLGMMPDSTRERLTQRLEDAGLPVTDEALLRLFRLEN